jgi:hypothetical protein
VLGYDVDSQGGRLVVNAKEAAQVREMYRVAAGAESLEAALRAIQVRRFQTKAWKSRAGRHVARPFSRMTLRLLLSNILYTGAVNHKGTIYPGEHERIVEQELWERVNTQLSLRCIHQRGRTHHRQEAPLRGLLYRAACGSAMSPSYTTKRGRRYRYYSCQTSAGKEGKDCSQRPVAAIDLEESILKNLEPVLGAGLHWNTIREAIHDVQYEWLSHRVVIGLKEGTRLEYEMRLPNRRGASGGEREADGGRVPRVSRLMALAIKFEQLIREGEIRNHRDIAEAGQISRARLSQIMRLTDLAPGIQEELLFLPKTVAGPDRITERALRQVAQSIDWDRQRRQFEELKAPEYEVRARRGRDSSRQTG